MNWEAVRQKADKHTWAKEIVNEMSSVFDEMQRKYPYEPPRRQSDWYHYYFCPVCGTRLQYDILKPNEHLCTRCDKSITGEPYDGVWAKLTHGAIVTTMENAVILAGITDDPKYAKYLHDTVMFYANNYLSYEIHGEHAGKGRLFPQCLSEAIYIIALQRILKLAESLNIFSDVEQKLIGEGIFKPAVELIKPQIKMIHNIHEWMQAAIAAAAVYLNDGELLKQTIHGEFGFAEQLSKGCTADGLWYEISLAYHFYTLNAFLSHAEAAKDYGIDLYKEFPLMEKMGLVALELAYPNGKLPAYNDSWFDVSLFGNIHVYEKLAAAYDKDVFKAFLNFAYLQDTATESGLKQMHNLPNLVMSEFKSNRNSLFSLINNIEADENTPEYQLPNRSRLLEHSGIGIIQNEKIRLALKYNKYGGWHDHNDKLAVDLMVNGELISYDMGTVGYGIEITSKWYRSPYAHNMVVINGEKQQPSDGEGLFFGETRISASAANAYPGVKMQRDLRLTDTGFTDCFRIDCKNESEIDYVFHCKGRITCMQNGIELETSPAQFSYVADGYLKDTGSAVVHGDFKVFFKNGEAENSLVLDVTNTEDTTIYISNCFGYETSEILGHLVLRRKTSSTEFNIEFKPAK